MKLHLFVSLKRPDLKVRLVCWIRNVEYPLARPTLNKSNFHKLLETQTKNQTTVVVENTQQPVSARNYGYAGTGGSNNLGMTNESGYKQNEYDKKTLPEPTISIADRDKKTMLRIR